MFFKALIKVLRGLNIDLTFLRIRHLKDNVAAVFQSHVQDFFILIAIEEMAVLVNYCCKDLNVSHL